MPISPEITAMESGCLSRENTGLGNCLFQIASVYGIAKKYSVEDFYNNVVLFSDKLEKNYGFKHKYTIFRNFQKKIDVPFTAIDDKNWRRFDTALIHTIQKNKEKYFMIKEYLEYPGYFLEYTDELRNLFSPDEHSLKILQESLPYLFDDTPTVAVHLRKHGVILNWNANVYARSVNISYYQQAVSKIEEHVKNPHYVVFSDEKINTVSFLDGKNYTIVNLEEDYLDLWAMSFCKHYILSQSTFCYWGWFLNSSHSKTTIVPRIDTLNFYDETPCIKL